MFHVASKIFETAVRIRHTCYDRGLLKTHKVSVPVVSVGGIEAGGTGKTQVVQYVVRWLLAHNMRPGLLTRGYKRTSHGLVVRLPPAPALADALGDEPAMLVQAGCDIPIASCANRVEGAHALIAHGCNVLVLDDGFSHRAIHRDVNIVVLRKEAPFGNGFFLPKGPLRESPESLARADVLWFHRRTSSAEPGASLPLPPNVVCVQSHQTALRFSHAVHSPVIAVAGVAHPHDFFRMLQDQGVVLAHTEVKQDHHAYTMRDVQHLQALCAHHGCGQVVTTAKDAVKLAALWPSEGLVTAHTTLQITEGEELFTARLRPFL